ncbi:EAL domain-containing protein [Yoonia sp. MH D7]
MLTGLPSHNLLAAVIFAVDSPVLIIDLAGQINFVNCAFQTRTVLLDEIRVGAKFSRYCAGGDVARVDAFLANPNPSSGVPQQISAHLTDPTTCYRCRLGRVTDLEGICIGFVCQIEDERIQKSDLADRLGLSLEVAGVGIWEYRIDDKITYWDQRVCTIYGLDPTQNELRSGDWEGFLHPDDKEKVLFDAERRITNKIDFVNDYRIVRADGAVRHVRSRAKYVHADHLSGARFIGVNIDITDDVRKTEELEAAHAAMEHDSRHDALTGLANRRKLDEVYRAFIQAEKDAARVPDFAVLSIDLDHFKAVNDTLGHSIGDLVLKHAANLITTVVADAGLVSRMGGDEFVVFLPGPFTDSQINELVAGILYQTSKLRTIEGHVFHFGMSIGTAKNSGISFDLSSVFAASDLALYQAKRAGRGRACHYQESMKPHITQLKLYGDDINRAMAENQFICRYRPQFSALTGALEDVEALLLWQHPTIGLLDPTCFLPAAEAAGLVREVTEHVMRMLLADQAGWAAAGLIVPCVSIKVITAFLHDPNLICVLDNLGAAAGRIRFELVDLQMHAENEAMFVQNLTVCRDCGIDIEIGNFGAGNSPVFNVLEVAPQRIAIDLTLIEAMILGDDEHQIVAAVVRIAKLMGAKVTAKGLQTLHHVNLAKKIGFDVLQGDCLAPTLAETDLRAILIAS